MAAAMNGSPALSIRRVLCPKGLRTRNFTSQINHKLQANALLKFVQLDYTAAMTKFVPGNPVREFKTKSGQRAVIRYPNWTDLEQYLDYLNQLSTEDTFVPLAGEKVSRE